MAAWSSGNNRLRRALVLIGWANSILQRNTFYIRLIRFGEVAEWLKAVTCKGGYTTKIVSEVRILPLSANFSKPH